MDITLAIPTLNEEDYLENTLDCLQERVKECDHDVKTIILDGDSSDRTLEIAGNHPLPDELYRLGTRGLLYARDMAFRVTDSDIVVSADADTQYEENWLVNLVEPLKDSEIVMTYGKAEGKDSERMVRSIMQPTLMIAFDHHASGANRAIRRYAYFISGGYDLSVSGPDIFLEEELKFPHRMEKIGKVKYVKDAISIQSDRNMKSLLGEEKTGGHKWEILNQKE